jgi:6-phosphogluconolactonase
MRIRRKLIILFVAILTQTGCSKSWGQFWAPVISGFSPAFGAEGDTVTVSGQQFTGAIADYVVRIGNATVTPLSLSENRFTFQIPAGASTGKIEITTRDTTVRSDQDLIIEKHILYLISNGGTVHGHICNNATGALTTIAGLPTGGTTNDLTADSQGRYLYITKGFANNIAGYTIDKKTGILTNLPGSPFGPIAGGTENKAIGIDALNKSLYAHDVGSSVFFRFSIDTATGVLTQQQSIPMASVVSNFISDTAGRYLYASTADNQIHGYSINPTSGALMLLSGSPYTGGAGFQDARLTPDEKFVFTTQSAGNSIVRFDADMTTGNLSTTPNAAAVGSSFFSIAITASGKYLFAADNATATLRGYPLNSLGALGTETNVTAGSAIRWVRITRNDKYLFAIQTSGSVTTYVIAANGSLSAVPGGTYTTGANAQQAIVVRIRQ